MHNKRLVLAHLWVAFLAFLAASLLGVWQMAARSPFAPPFFSHDAYFLSVTAHGVAMAYVLPTFFIMGFGYCVAETALERRLGEPGLAWLAFSLALIGTAMAGVTIAAGRASVLYTFYPPLTGAVTFYLGLVLVVIGSWIWCGQMIVEMIRWKREQSDAPVPLAMFATVANAILWLWTTVGVASELLFQVIPAALGWTDHVDVGLSRTLFSWTLHAIVYFWLIPAYIAFYTMAPRAAGGYLFSDTMGRLTFILFLVYSLPVGMHHLFMDPEHSTGFKFVQMTMTALVAAPTLLTVFTISASFEIGGRLRGGKGLFGWIAALPWHQPMVLATGLAFFMLFFGGGGGLINMSYGMNAMVHNTSWVTAHFHLIYGGTVVIMYFAIAYTVWPVLTGRQALSLSRQRLQLWLWAIGMMVMTVPWHVLGLQGQWRRVAEFNYYDPVIAPWAPYVVLSLLGGFILFISAALFIFNLAQFHRSDAIPIKGAVALYARALHPPQRVPAALNGFGLWNAIVLTLMVLAYGWPIAQFFVKDAPPAIVHRTDGRS